MRALHNRDWGFDTNCFVCEPRNERGLRVRFFESDNRIVARFTLDNSYSGAPQYVHGGIVLALLDEAMAWATIALAQKIAVTKRTSAEFARPVRVGRPHAIEAFVDAADTTISTSAVVRDERDRLCATAQATFVPLGPAQLRQAIGAQPTSQILTTLADDHPQGEPDAWT